MVSWHPDNTACGRCQQCREQNKRQQESTDTGMLSQQRTATSASVYHHLPLNKCTDPLKHMWSRVWQILAELLRTPLLLYTKSRGRKATSTITWSCTPSKASLDVQTHTSPTPGKDCGCTHHGLAAQHLQPARTTLLEGHFRAWSWPGKVLFVKTP